MTLRYLLPVAIVLCLSFSFAREAAAVADCSVCGPTTPCVLRCKLNCPGPGCFVTTCGELGPCNNDPFAVDGDESACGAGEASSVTLAAIVAGWMQEAVSWVERAAQQLAFLIEPVRESPVELARAG